MRKYLRRSLLMIVLVIGYSLGDVKIQWGSYSSYVSTRTITTQLSKLQDIKGTFFRSPGESLGKELGAFNDSKITLDLRTYEFTQKDFKSALKKLAASGVNIRIIVEDRKYQQFQNTLKELQKYFS